MLAEISDNTWTVIIGAIFLGLAQLLNIFLSWLNGRTAKRTETKTDVQTAMLDVAALRSGAPTSIDVADELSKSQIGSRK